MSLADISLLSALLAGALSFLSPCVLPLVPPYLCYMAGVSVEQFRGGGAAVAGGPSVPGPSVRGNVLMSALFFTLGFATVFVALGAGASSIGMLLRQHLDILAKIGGLIIVIMGLNFLGVFRIGLLAREARFQSGGKPATLTGAYIMGLAFAFGWTPCIGPQLGAILSMAASEASLTRGTLLLGVYALGLGIPFLIVAAFLPRLGSTLGFFKRHMAIIERIMGLLLWTVGLMMLTGGFAAMSYWLLENFPALSRLG